ncbi:MAG: hypothetical protein C0514_04010 [Candidatus Puniceispirillum sp.]|nr:hypothetical protein [Candidatus Puniceispirillum sp.]
MGFDPWALVIYNPFVTRALIQKNTLMQFKLTLLISVASLIFPGMGRCVSQESIEEASLPPARKALLDPFSFQDHGVLSHYLAQIEDDKLTALKVLLEGGSAHLACQIVDLAASLTCEKLAFAAQIKMAGQWRADALKVVQEMALEKMPLVARLLVGAKDAEAYGILKNANSLSCGQLQFILNEDFEPAHRAGALRVAHKLTPTDVEALKKLMNGAGVYEAEAIARCSVDRDPKELAFVIEADFEPGVRAAVLDVVGQLTKDKIAPLKRLLEGVGSGWYRDIVAAAAPLSVAQMTFVMGANFEDVHRAAALQVAPHLTDEKVALIKRLIEGVDSFTATFIIKAAGPLSPEHIQFVIAKDFPIKHREAALETAQNLEDTRILPLKKLLEGTQYDLAKEIAQAASLLSPERMTFVSKADFETKHRAAALEVAGQLTQDKIVPLKKLLEGVSAFWSKQVCQAAAPLEAGVLTLVAEGDFDPSHRALILPFAGALSRDKYVPLKKLLKDANVDRIVTSITKGVVAHSLEELKRVEEAGFEARYRPLALDLSPHLTLKKIALLKELFEGAGSSNTVEAILRAGAERSPGELTFVKKAEFDVEHRAAVLGAVHQLSADHVGPLKALLEGADFVEARKIVGAAAHLAPSQLDMIAGGDFKVSHRFAVLENASALTEERVGPLKKLLEGTDDFVAQDICRAATERTVEEMAFIAEAEFAPSLRAYALLFVRQLTQEKIPPLKKLLEDLRLDQALSLFQVGAPLAPERLTYVRDAKFAPSHRVAALQVAPFLHDAQVSVLKTFLERGDLSDYQQNFIIAMTALGESHYFTYLEAFMKDVPPKVVSALVFACAGHGEDALKRVLNSPPKRRAKFLNYLPRTDGWLFDHAGQSQAVDDEVIIPELAKRLGARPHEMLALFEERLGGADREVLTRICDFILRAKDGFRDFNFTRLGWSEDHPVVQNAIAKQIVLAQDITDPKNPWYIWRQMLNKRALPVDFDAVTPEPKIVAGKRVSINPAAIARFASGFAIEEASVPDLEANVLERLVNRLEGRMTPQMALEIEGMQSPPISFNVLKVRTLGTQGHSFLTSLMHAKKTDFYGAKLRCLLTHLMTFDDTVNAPHQLSPREARLVHLLTNLRECDTGQAGDLEELYNALPEKAKYTARSDIFDWENITPSQRLGYAFLMRTAGEGVREVLGQDNVLMRRICGVPEKGTGPDGKPLKIEQLVHQAKYLINFIGRDLGVPHVDSFPHDAGLYYQQMLRFDKAPLIKMYYAYAWEEGRMLSFFRHKINETLKSPATDGLFKGLDSLRPLSMASAQMWDVNLDGRTRITDQGLVALLVQAGILRESTNALPWGR